MISVRSPRNLPRNLQVEIAASRGKLGSIDANRNEMLLGWDTDMFPTDPALAAYTMKRVIEQGGLQPGGLNFDAKVRAASRPSHTPHLKRREPPPNPALAPHSQPTQVRRESTDLEDLFIGHINGMDNYARGLRAAAKMIEDGTLDAMRARRYAGFEQSAIGKKFASGEATLEMLATRYADFGNGRARPRRC